MYFSIPLKFIKTCFRSQKIVLLGECSMWTRKKKSVFYICFVNYSLYVTIMCSWLMVLLKFSIALFIFAC